MSSSTVTYKSTEQAAWNRFAPRYARVALPEFRPYGRRLIALAEVRAGTWVLDVATGPGEPALTLARRVGRTGWVLGVDFSKTMLRLAQARARRLGVTHVQFRQMDAESLTLPDRLFDHVFCRFGLMLMPQPARALAEMYRVLVPGGRVALAVWSSQQKVNTMGLVRKALIQHDAFTPPVGAPDFFRFGKAGALERALRAAGFRQVRSERLTVDWVFAGTTEFWNAMKQGPSLKRALAPVSPAIRRSIKAEVFRALARFERHGRLHIPNEAVLAVGVRPSP